ncbi:UvrD-helicase domain-containing protein, partial [Treponema pallidum]|uniref:UvrD-helicase domain-containing protein n=1 Tax=Treponema pallidum TaxID=160 RepID=UPI0015899CE3
MLSTLNPEQRRAVTTLEGPLLIIAGAGSGKTRVITARIAYMLECGILQSRILALTFTNKAAHEMSERIKALTGKSLRNMTVSTFHAFGVTILREHIHVLGWRKNFSIYDENDKRALIREAAKEVHLLPEVLDTNCVSTLFSAIKMQRKNLK